MIKCSCVVLLSSKTAVFQGPPQKGVIVKDYEDDFSVLRVGYFRMQCWRYGITRVNRQTGKEEL